MKCSTAVVTQDAREVIEKAGVVMFKDASANKGGVTSSSLEVLAALVLTDEEFRAHMAVSKEACAAGRPADALVRLMQRRILVVVHTDPDNTWRIACSVTTININSYSSWRRPAASSISPVAPHTSSAPDFMNFSFRLVGGCHDGTCSWGVRMRCRVL